jgi:serine racemase
MNPDFVGCISYDDVEKAYSRISDTIHRTPVLTSATVNEIATERALLASIQDSDRRRSLFFKVEAWQKTGSFKFRGALNAVRCVVEEHLSLHQSLPRNISVVTHSSGNHAQALALAAQCCSIECSKKGHDCQIKATIVMPRNTPVVKKDAVSQTYQGEIVLVDNTNEARELEAEKIVEVTNGTFIHPSEDPRVIAGQGTVGYELLSQMEESFPGVWLDVIVIPVGGGGLASGNLVSLLGKPGGRRPKIVLAEPSSLDDAHRSFYAKELMPHDPSNLPLSSVADGLKTTLGPNTFPIILNLADSVITVSELEILQATKLIWERLKVVVEPSAGVGVAVALSSLFNTLYPIEANPNVGIILCGGNVDIIKVSAKMKEFGL